MSGKLNKMTEYRINDLERLSGIKAHTIRIWEKRYHLIEPVRTSTNRRTYSSEQLIRLMNVSTLLGSGYKISAVAAMSTEEITTQIASIHDTAGQSAVVAAYINELMLAMIAFDEPAFDEVLSKANKSLGFTQCMLEVVYPMLRKTGLLWRTQKVAPIQEHFASHLIKRKLSSAIENLPRTASDSSSIVLFLPSEEWHDIGLLFTHYLLKQNGYNVIYLGQNVPGEDLDIVVSAVAPFAIVTFFVSPRPAEEIVGLLGKLGKEHPKLKVLYAGSPEMLGDLKFKVDNIKYLSSVPELLKLLK